MSVMTEIANRYKEEIAALSGVLPGVADAYHRFTGACFEPGELDVRTKHLIALGAALFANNEACTCYHVREALDHGATARQVMEAVAVAAAACGGHALAQGVMRVLGDPGGDGSSGRAADGASRPEADAAARSVAWRHRKNRADGNGAGSPAVPAAFDPGMPGGEPDDGLRAAEDNFPHIGEVSPSF